MNKLSLFKEIVVSLGLSFLAFINIVFWQNSTVGWLILVIFIWYFSFGLHKFLRQNFGISGSLRIRVLVLFLILGVLGSVSGLIALVFKMSPIALSVGMFITGIFFSFLKLRVRDEEDEVVEIEDESKQVIEELPSSKIGVFLYLVLVFSGFYFLYDSKSTLVSNTPWQTISPHFIWLFFATTLVLGMLVFYRLKSGTILFLLIIHAFLLHSYLPLSHDLFYGADGWRHLATQSSWWQNGNLISPTLSLQPAGFWQRLDLGALAYSQFNALSLLFQKLCQVDAIEFIRYFLPITWSIILPIILFEIGRVYGLDKKAALFLVWISAWPFALQVSGSFSLPVNLSLLFWLLALWLQIKNSQNRTDSGTLFLIVLGTLSISIHTVFFVLFWFSFVLINLLKINFSKIGLFLITLLSALIIPAIELVSNFSNFNNKLNWWTQIKYLLSSLSGWYTSFGLRTSDISVGNIFFNQPPLGTLINSVFISGRGMVVVLMLLFWLIWFFGTRKMLQADNNINNFWAVFSVGLLGSYIVSRYFLSGDNIFTRRLDATLAVLFILPVVYFGYDYLKNKAVIFLVIFIISVATTTSYLLGPDTLAVSSDEYNAAAYIWDREQDSQKVCVLADTFPLLALEQISSRKVVGGGFPINSSFAQPERLKLLDLAATNPRAAATESKILINSQSCYLVGDYNFIGPIAQYGNVKIYNF